MTRLLLALLLMTSACAPKAGVEVHPELATSPRAPSVRQGTLDNGVRYYVSSNSLPPGQAELRVVVDPGGQLDDPDQDSLAKLVHHLAPIQAQQRFKEDPRLQAVDFDLASHADLDQGTYVRPRYDLTFPTDDPAVEDLAVQLAWHWAHAVEFEEEVLDRHYAEALAAVRALLPDL